MAAVARNINRASFSRPPSDTHSSPSSPAFASLSYTSNRSWTGNINKGTSAYSARATSTLDGPAFPMPDVPSDPSNWRLSTSKLARSRKQFPARQLPTTYKINTRAINKRSPALSTVANGGQGS